MSSQKALLRKLLHTLVDEWGYEAVSTALARTSGSSNGTLAGLADGTNVRIPRKEARLGAIGQIERAALEGDQKEILLQIAIRYDRRLFLPSVADVREFLIMMGERPIGMKDRKEAFRVLLRSLTQLPVARLQQLAQTALHSGPAELGPLSDAIAAAGGRLPRQRQASD